MVNLTTVQELKQIWVETLMNKTDKVTKVSDNSVLSGIAFGDAKVGQKALKDIALIKSRLYPNEAFDDGLDEVASNNGISPRFTTIGSSTFVRLVGDEGTIYLVGTHTFSGDNGIIFDLEENITIGAAGFTYAKIRSQDVGSKTNVDALTLNKVTPIPFGHKYVINEYRASGGRDNEQDDVFRKRIMEGPNILARGTISMLEQVFIKINNNVLKIFYQGINSLGQTVIAIATQNGIDLTNQELDDILDKGSEYLNLSDLKPFGTQNYGVTLKNIEYQAIDISFRVDLFPSFNPDNIRKEIQIRFSKYLDFRFWDSSNKVDWVTLLDIVRSTKGVKYAPDNFFTPSVDVTVDKNKMPRIRGFLMLNLNGTVISNLTGTLSPVFYPNLADFSYQSTALSSI